MTWGRFDDKLPRHAKYAPLSDAAFRLAIHANLWAREMGSGGFVPRAMLPDIVRFRGRKLERAIEELLGAGAPLYTEGIWQADDSGDGWWIHDFEDYGAPGGASPALAGSSLGAEGRRGRSNSVDPELSRKRAEAGRRGALSKHRRAAEAAEAAGITLTGSSAPANDTAPLAAAPVNGMAAAQPNRLAKLPAPSGKGPGKPTSLATPEDLKRDPNPLPNPEDPPKPPVGNSGKALASEGLPPPPIRERAQAFLRDPTKATMNWGSPEKWPEVEALCVAFAETWGRQDRPRSGGDPRVRVILQRYAAGRSQEELTRAVRASKRYGPIADKPEYQRLKTILRDDEQVDNLLRLESAPRRTKGPQRAKQRGGWAPPRLEVAK